VSFVPLSFVSYSYQSISQPIVRAPPVQLVIRQPQRHLQRIRSIIVRADRKIPKLLHE
jgi:hypothetical protein